MRIALLLAALLCAASTPAGEAAALPAMPGFVTPAPGEHPRLLFRRSELPRLKQRAATPAGMRLVARLRQQLDGGTGTTLPVGRNPQATGDDPGDLLDAPVGSVLTLFHAVGYGMLWQLTGERASADLALEAAALVIAGHSDRDARFGLRAAAGGEYNGAAVAALALAYDLCHDAWDDAARRRVAAAVTTALADRKVQVSPTAAALWSFAVAGDSGDGRPIAADEALRTLLGVLDKLPPFGISGRDVDIHDALRDVTLPLAVHAARVAGGVDLAQHLRVGQLVDRLIYLTVPSASGVQLALSYDYAPMGGQHLLRTGLAGGGQFVQAMAMANPDRRAALRFVYERFVTPAPGGEAACDHDTVGPYPHRSALALACWPFDEAARDPGTLLPPVAMAQEAGKDGIPICIFRGSWNGPDDFVVALMPVRQDGRPLAEPRNPAQRCRIWAQGQRFLLRGMSNGFVRDLGPIWGVKQIAERRWLVSFARDWGAVNSHPAPMRLIVDLDRRDGLEGVVICEAILPIGDLPDAPRAERIDLAGEWRCSTALAVRVEQDGERFRVVSDNPWGRGKPVEGRIAGAQVSLTRLGNGLARGRVAPHGHAIAWEDGAVWRRLGSPLAAPAALTPDATQRTLVRQLTNKARDTLICVLTCSAQAKHGEFACTPGQFPVVTIGGRSFSFAPDQAAPAPTLAGDSR